MSVVRSIASAAILLLASARATGQNSIIVSPDGANGAFTTVQSAIDSVPDNATQPTLILIRPGTYKGLVHVPASKTSITLRGEDTDASKATIVYGLYASFVRPGTTQPTGTDGTATLLVDAPDFTAENLAIENSAGEKGQAVAARTLGDRAVFRNCRFLGWQDTLYPDAGRQYFVDCYVEGRADFIFGAATAVFDHCTIHSKKGGYVTAARTPPEQAYGFVFLDCTLTGDATPTYLGRPWRWDRGSKSSVTFVRTKMGPHIRREGWNPWDHPGMPNTQPATVTRYGEFASTNLEGKPLDISGRVNWSHQLTPEQAAEYTVAKILGGDDHWNPASATSTKPDHTP